MIAIVIPAYNAERTIVDTIESAIYQNYDDNLYDIVVANDGSTDGTWREIYRYKGTDIVERMYNWPHRGIQVTVNEAIARGDYHAVVVLGADDRLHPDFLKRTVPLLTDNVGVVSTDMRYTGEQRGVCRTGGCWPTNTVPASSLIRRAAWDEVGGYDPAMGYEDWDLWLSIKKAGWQFAVVHDPLVYYRVGINQRSKEALSKKAEYEKQIIEKHKWITEQP